MSPIKKVFDIVMSPFTILAAVWFRVIKFWTISSLPLTKKILILLGVQPLVNHYYEAYLDIPLIEKAYPAASNDVLFDLRCDEQMNLLDQLKYVSEELSCLKGICQYGTGTYVDNPSFSNVDATFLFSFIRKFKPNKIIEIGSGVSTQIMIEALSKTQELQDHYSRILTCIEPFEASWLETLPVQVIRSKVEDLPLKLFTELKCGDIVFIDSSHIIKPFGDVPHEILKILPQLAIGVNIHFHDIFLPYPYPIKWYIKDYRNWNEQELLHAFLAYNQDFEVLFASQYLSRQHPDVLQTTFPILANSTPGGGSFWLKKIG